VTIASGVVVLLGNGDGTFQTPVSYATRGSPGALVVADFNGDGKPDLAVQTWHQTLSVLFGNGDGTFQPATDYVAGSDFDETYGIVVGDFNGDQKPDLVLADGPASTITVLLNQGSGGFKAARGFPVGRKLM
jgi:FG-GAP-like repeat